MAERAPVVSAWPGWEARLLHSLGVAPTLERRRFLAAWHACEGGGADFNPLNTTMPVAGATDYNSAGVKNYPDELAGLAATLLTLRLGYYDELRAALAARNITALRIARRSSAALARWGTGSACILSRVGRAGPGSGRAASGRGTRA